MGSMGERGLQQGDLGCDRALTGIMMRNPFKGARSTVLYNRFFRDRHMILEHIRDKVPMPKKMSAHNGLPWTDTYQHFDNFCVRTLSGRYDEPPGMMTREHLEMAKEALRRIDVVIILEEIHEHYDSSRKSSAGTCPARQSTREK